MKEMKTENCKWHGVRSAEQRTHTLGIMLDTKSVLIISSSKGGPKIEPVSEILSCTWQEYGYDAMVRVSRGLQYGDDAFKAELNGFLLRCKPLSVRWEREHTEQPEQTEIIQ